MILDNDSFIIYSATIVFHKNFLSFFFLFKSLHLFISPRISFQNRIDNKYFSRPIFIVTFTKNIFILSNSDFIISFKFRSVRIYLNFLSQGIIIKINSFFINTMMISIIVLIYHFIQTRKIRFTIISFKFCYRF